MESNNEGLSELAEQLNALIQAYETLKEEQEELRNENVTLKTQLESQVAQTAKLEDELGMKELEADDLIEKIKQAIGS